MPAQVDLLQAEWIPAPAATPPPDWAILGPPSTLAGQLSAAYPQVPLLALGPALSEAPTARRTTRWPPVILVVPHSATPRDDASQTAARTVPALVQAALAEKGAPRLVFLTQDAVTARSADVVTEPGQGVLRELVLAAQAEHPGRFSLIDIDRETASLPAVSAALGTPLPQQAIRSGTILTLRAGAVRLLPDVTGPPLLSPPGGQPWRLTLVGKGTLDNLALEPSPDVERLLVGDQVRIAVQAAGVNFRDVLDTFGLYPGDPGPLGAEGAGIVLETGPQARRLAPGDRVMGLLTGAFGPIAVSEEPLLVTVPQGWSAERAAAVPVAFATAWYALHDLAALRAGERVLIHCATGGVGSAAVEIAHYLGAEVFATAGPSKHPVLRERDIADDHLASSRSTDFEQQFLATTCGRGLDVVLNALAHEATDAALRLVRPGGRFIEMGKTDLRDPGQVADDHLGVDYQAFELKDAGPRRIGEILSELRRLLTTGALRPPAVHTFDVRDAVHAFHHMSRARHTGKIVLRIPPPPEHRGSALLTGPVSDTAPLALHLATRYGTDDIWLVGPNHSGGSTAEQLRTRLDALHTRLHMIDADANDSEALRRAVGGIPASSPLTTVVHTAAGAALTAAATLDRLTRDLPLGAFLILAPTSPDIPRRSPHDLLGHHARLEEVVAHRRASGRAATLLVLPPDSPPAPDLLPALYDAAQRADRPMLLLTDRAAHDPRAHHGVR
ncbi:MULTISPECIES: zinc-binding dehydrogenase [unclassified Streptomyces]|uniref:zinc-binding dehydrogenase n=1 Tax=unclassified Streptomyces TaxID=2593676 RepID=UPI00093B73D1|nr:zinc-binding dehydrogenase [Streptomyces sp. TSRI0281]